MHTLKSYELYIIVLKSVQGEEDWGLCVIISLASFGNILIAKMALKVDE